MPDVHDKATRSRNMAAIKGKDTKPELIIRKLLHSQGFRYRIHDKSLPGHPDLVLPRYKAVIFIHGCFWHMHECHLFKWPQSRQEFWRTKISHNAQNDCEIIHALQQLGWRVLTVWECSIKGENRLSPEEITGKIALWLKSCNKIAELGGKQAA